MRVGGQPRVGGQRLKRDITGAAARTHHWQQLALRIVAQLLDHLAGIEVRQRPHFEIELALGRHDVQCPAPLNHTRLHGGEWRVEACIVQVRLGQLNADFAQLADQARRVFDGIDALWRVRRVACSTLHLAAHG
ncbi:hypothetical protein D3C81_1722230 [compost metagenome]